jgi:hypothetical protein
VRGQKRTMACHTADEFNHKAKDISFFCNERGLEKEDNYCLGRNDFFFIRDPECAPYFVSEAFYQDAWGHVDKS